MILKRMGGRIKNLSHSIDWIGDDGNFGNASRIGSSHWQLYFLTKLLILTTLLTNQIRLIWLWKDL